jgi:hypothetical protein
MADVKIFHLRYGKRESVLEKVLQVLETWQAPFLFPLSPYPLYFLILDMQIPLFFLISHFPLPIPHHPTWRSWPDVGEVLGREGRSYQSKDVQ